MTRYCIRCGIALDFPTVASDFCNTCYKVMKSVAAESSQPQKENEKMMDAEDLERDFHHDRKIAADALLDTVATLKQSGINIAAAYLALLEVCECTKYAMTYSYPEGEALTEKIEEMAKRAMDLIKEQADKLLGV